MPVPLTSPRQLPRRLLADAGVGPGDDGRPPVQPGRRLAAPARHEPPGGERGDTAGRELPGTDTRTHRGTDRQTPPPPARPGPYLMRGTAASSSSGTPTAAPSAAPQQLSPAAAIAAAAATGRGFGGGAATGAARSKEAGTPAGVPIGQRGVGEGQSEPAVRWVGRGEWRAREVCREGAGRGGARCGGGVPGAILPVGGHAWGRGTPRGVAREGKENKRGESPVQPLAVGQAVPQPVLIGINSSACPRAAFSRAPWGIPFATYTCVPIYIYIYINTKC